MMKKEALYFVMALIIFGAASCGTKIEMENVYGKWISVPDPDDGYSDETQQIEFTKNGKYKVVISNKDSVMNSFEGTFKLNRETHVIKMINEGFTLKDMKITKLTFTGMTVVVGEEGEGGLILNYRKE